jgi:serine/threonine protein kinase
MNRKGYIHRDLRLENISFERVDDFRTLKITSFLAVKKKEEQEKTISGINGSVRHFNTFTLILKIVLIHGS